MHTAAEMALESVPNARMTLESGFTTVRDVGVYRALNDIALRDAIAKGYIVGPRMFVAGAYVTISGGAGAMTGFAPDITLPGISATARPTALGKSAKKFASSPTTVPTRSNSSPAAPSSPTAAILNRKSSRPKNSPPPSMKPATSTCASHPTRTPPPA